MTPITIAEAVPIWRWRYFSPREVACRCTHTPRCIGDGMLIIVSEFLDLMDRLRTEYGKPLMVSSWYRSPAHNDKVSGTGRNGPHTTGCAVDLAVQGGDAYRVLQIAIQLGFVGVGIQQKGTGRFVHLDMSTVHARPAVWSY